MQRFLTAGTLALAAGLLLRGIRLRRDRWVSVRYAKELNSTTSSVILQSTDRHDKIREPSGRDGLDK